ncbi:hypothetical protein KJ682_07325 [bacterium]|nr:hypothetical protein [bacterium]
MPWNRLLSPRRPWTAVIMTLAGAVGLGVALIFAACPDRPITARQHLLDGVCWGLVMGGVSGTFLAGAGFRFGWLILLGLQPVWIAYSVVTGQFGFVIGSVAYAGAQVNGYIRASTIRAMGESGRHRSAGMDDEAGDTTGDCPPPELGLACPPCRKKDPTATSTRTSFSRSSREPPPLPGWSSSTSS